jgi:hypothetical protein
MKYVYRTVLFHLLCILFFGYLYMYMKNHFDTDQDKNRNMGLIDYMLLSTTIQAGVGVSDIYPISLFGKLSMIVQQLLMIMTHVFTFYLFR